MKYLGAWGTLIHEKTLKSKISCQSPFKQRLNMELDPQSLFGLHVYSCPHWLRPRNPPPPPFGLIYEGAIGQPR
jgi:hypothetical protein